MKEDLRSDNGAQEQPNPAGKMDRREFFATAGKMVIPTIALMGLSLSGFSGQVQAAGCDDCNRNCKDSCLGGCSGGCQGDCRGGCQGSCTGCTGTAR